MSEQIELRRGTYIAMLGPNYETQAEACWLRVVGDVVGMSTVPEVLTAALAARDPSVPEPELTPDVLTRLRTRLARTSPPETSDNNA